MRKEDVIRLSIYSFPRDCLPFFLKLSDFFFFRRLGDRFFVAFEADAVARHSGEGLGLKEGMACITFQPLLSMLFVIERDRLVGLRTKAEAEEKKAQRNTYSKSDDEGFQFSDPSRCYFMPPFIFYSILYLNLKCNEIFSGK